MRYNLRDGEAAADGADGQLCARAQAGFLDKVPHVAAHRGQAHAEAFAGFPVGQPHREQPQPKPKKYTCILYKACYNTFVVILQNRSRLEGPV